MTANTTKYQASVRANPVKWCERALGVSLWSKQAEILEAVRDHPRVAVRSSNAVGKTYTAALAAIWFLEGHHPSYVVITSSSWDQVRKAMWPEMRKRINQAPYSLGGELLTMEWQRGDQWGAFSVSPDAPENFGGFRAPGGTLVIIDEASSLADETMDAITGLCAGSNSKILMIGNPLRPSGPFFDAFSDPAWHCMSISAFESPNVVQRKDAIPGLATLEYIESAKNKWGEGSPQYMARVLGEFPDIAEDVLIPLSWAEAAIDRNADTKRDHDRTHMGADIARGGGDRIVIIIRDHRAVRYMEIRQHKSLMNTAGRIMRLADQWGIPGERVHIDDIGMGGGVTDRLHELDFAVDGVNFAAKGNDPDAYLNLRAECFWRVRDALNPTSGATRLGIPNEYRELATECTVPHLDFTSRGQIKIEAKDSIKKRLGRSPDLADALALSYRPYYSVDIFIPGGHTNSKLMNDFGQEESGEPDDDPDMDAIMGDDGWK